MSKHVRGSDFLLVMQQWTRVFMPIVGREQDAWEEDWVLALDEMPYLRLIRKERSFVLDKLIGLRVQMNYIGGNMQMVRNDMERVWSEGLSKDMESYPTFNTTEDGFEFLFAALPKKSEYITGTIQVLEKRTR